MKTTIALALILAALQEQPLPKAEDVLPKGEVSKGSLVVTGDGFRYQVQPELKLVDDPRGKPACKGTIEGMLSKAEIAVMVKEKFEGDLEALVKREREKVTSKTGKLSFDTPVKLFIGGALNPATGSWPRSRAGWTCTCSRSTRARRTSSTPRRRTRTAPSPTWEATS